MTIGKNVSVNGCLFLMCSFDGLELMGAGGGGVLCPCPDDFWNWLYLPCGPEKD